MNTTINATNYKGTLNDLIVSALTGSSVNYCTDNGTVVIMREEELRGLIATAEIECNPKFKAELLESMAEPWEDAVPLEDLI